MSVFFFFSSRRRHTRLQGDWSSDVCSSDLGGWPAIGVAVTPLLELSPGSADPVGWALPVNLEARHGDLRIYGSTGYFSRSEERRVGKRGDGRRVTEV